MWVKYHEIMKNPNNLAQFKYLNNKHSDTKFKYTNQETGRSIISFFNKFNQPSSTSTNNWNVLSEKIDQGTSQLEVKDHSKKVRIQSQMTRTVCLPFIETSYILQKKNDKNLRNRPIPKIILKLANREERNWKQIIIGLNSSKPLLFLVPRIGIFL